MQFNGLDWQSLCGLLYRYHEHFQFKTLNHGQLINPAIAVQPLGLYDEKQKKWQIVYMPQGCCDSACDKITFMLHQLRIALNKNSQRVNLTLVLSAACPVKQTHDFQKVIFTRAQYASFKTDSIYLVDPMGYLFMRYPATVNPLDILKDLKRVLEVSQIG